MRVLDNSEIDIKKWNEVILSSSLPLVFAQSFYLDATSPNWKALVNDNYSSIMPLTVKSKFGINYLIQPPFTPQLGVYGDCKKSAVSSFLKSINDKFKYISIELNAANFVSSSNTKDKRTFVIELEKKIEYNTNTKRNIAKAIKSGLTILELSDKETKDVSKKYLYPFLKNKLKLSSSDIKIFDQLLVNSLKEKFLKTWIVQDDDKNILALAHFISNGKHAVYLKGTAFDKNSGAMHFLMDHAINFFRLKEVVLFDFGGGQSESMARFYSGFGAKELLYKIYLVNNLPKPLKWIKK